MTRQFEQYGKNYLREKWCGVHVIASATRSRNQQWPIQWAYCEARKGCPVMYVGLLASMDVIISDLSAFIAAEHGLTDAYGRPIEADGICYGKYNDAILDMVENITHKSLNGLPLHIVSADGRPQSRPLLRQYAAELRDAYPNAEIKLMVLQNTIGLPGIRIDA